jgi:hypothetical protein
MFFFLNAIWLQTDFGAIWNPLKKLPKNLCKKVMKEKVTEKLSFVLLLLWAKVFGLYLFVCDFFASFLRIPAQHQILLLKIPIPNLANNYCLAYINTFYFLLTLKSNADETIQKM